MGLTIHYKLKANTPSIEEARKLLNTLRKYALKLPFKEVGNIVEFEGEECDFNANKNDEYRWLKIQSQQTVGFKQPYGDIPIRVTPLYIIAFTIWPGDGCEEANFGLCLYPETTEVKGTKILTNIDKGFYWKSFCKTQYASSPECGGIKNILQCHLAIIRLLDHANTIDILDSVNDESGYWEKRDLEALINEIGAWNEFIAGFVGMLKDAVSKHGKGLTVESEIAKYSNFEHLEAKFAQKNPEQFDKMRKTAQHLVLLMRDIPNK